MQVEKELIDKIRLYMQQNKITQVEMGKKTNTSQASVMRILQGKSIIYETYIKFKDFMKRKRVKPPF